MIFFFYFLNLDNHNNDINSVMAPQQTQGNIRTAPSPVPTTGGAGSVQPTQEPRMQQTKQYRNQTGFKRLFNSKRGQQQQLNGATNVQQLR